VHQCRASGCMPVKSGSLDRISRREKERERKREKERRYVATKVMARSIVYKRRVQ